MQYEFVASDFLQFFAVVAVTLYGVLDLDKIVNDLIELRKRKGFRSQHDFAKAPGMPLNIGKIQRIEKRKNKSGPPIEDMAAWLEYCGTSMAAYFTQLATVAELQKIKRYRDILDKVQRALKSERRREALRTYLDGMFADDDE